MGVSKYRTGTGTVLYHEMSQVSVVCFRSFFCLCLDSRCFSNCFWQGIL